MLEVGGKLWKEASDPKIGCPGTRQASMVRSKGSKKPEGA